MEPFARTFWVVVSLVSRLFARLNPLARIFRLVVTTTKPCSRIPFTNPWVNLASDGLPTFRSTDAMLKSTTFVSRVDLVLVALLATRPASSLLTESWLLERLTL